VDGRIPRDMDKEDRAIDVMMSAQDEVASSFKLCFTLSTGAVVIFAHLLFESRLPIVLLVLLASSILCFGYASVLCMHTIMALGMVRIGVAKAMVSAEDHRSEYFIRESAAAIVRAQTSEKRMERFFRAGIALAVTFVLGFVIVRLVAPVESAAPLPKNFVHILCTDSPRFRGDGLVTGDQTDPNSLKECAPEEAGKVPKSGFVQQLNFAANDGLRRF
jgi:hypothetical protein